MVKKKRKIKKNFDIQVETLKIAVKHESKRRNHNA